MTSIELKSSTDWDSLSDKQKEMIMENIDFDTFLKLTVHSNVINWDSLSDKQKEMLMQNLELETRSLFKAISSDYIIKKTRL